MLRRFTSRHSMPTAAVVPENSCRHQLHFVGGRGYRSVSASIAGWLCSLQPFTDPFLVVFGCGVIARLTTIGFSLYSDRSCARLAKAIPDLQMALFKHCQVIERPRGALWEKKISFKRLQSERSRIFRHFRTSNVSHVGSALLGCLLNGYYFISVVPRIVARIGAMSQQGLLTGSVSLSCGADAGVSTPLLLSECGYDLVATASPFVFGGVDFTCPIASVLLLFNIRSSLSRRMGMCDVTDKRVRTLNELAMYLCTGVAVAGVAGVLPATGGAFVLGMSFAGLLQSLVNFVSPLRRLFGIPVYPSTHGTYGGAQTGLALKLEDPALGGDPEEKWLEQKTLIEYECDLRLNNLLRSLGVLREHEEFLMDREALDRKIEVLHKMKASTPSPMGPQGTSGDGTNPQEHQKVASESSTSVSW